MSNLIELTSKNFDDFLERYDNIVLDFTADWCEPCQSFSALFQSVAQQFPDVLFATINVGKEQELASDFNVRSIPTIIILRYRAAVLIQSGAMTATEFIRLIEEAKSLSHSDIENFDAEKFK